MPKVVTIALTEYLNAVRTKAFIIGVLAMPVFMSGSFLVAHFTKDRTDLSTRRVAVADLSGKMFDPLEERARDRNAREIFEWNSGKQGKQIRPEFQFERQDLSAVPEDELEIRLSDRVRKKELFAFVIISPGVTSSDDPAKPLFRYFTQTPTYTDLPDWIERSVNSEIESIRFTEANIDRETVRKLTRRVSLHKMGLASTDTTSGEVIRAREENQLARFGVPAMSMMLLFVLIMMSAPALLNSVLEEKLQKISEVLLSCVSPFELMLGKLFGLVLVSLTLSLLYLGAAVILIWRFELGPFVPISLFFWFILFQLLALLIFGSVFSAIGAACSEIRDAQNMMFPAMLMVMIPLFTWMPVLQSPTSTFSRLISLFPPATPMLMMLRIAVPPGPPWWEIALGVLLTLLFMLACVWASAKIFRVGLLAQGQTPSFSNLVTWLWSK